MQTQMLTHARILEINITCCKMLQAKLLDAGGIPHLQTRITLFTKMLEAMEKVRFKSRL